MVIAMDGPACAGKSTLAVLTAKRLNINFLNTGMIFRAIAYVLTKEKVDINNLEEVKRTLNNANIDIEYINGEQVVYVEGIDTRPYISLPKISQKASIYSQIIEIRKIVSTIQHKFADKYDLVIEGRDIGTEVFPNAKYKFYITASVESRAKRRFETYIQNGENITYEEVKNAIIERDYNDMNRKISPLKQADDSIVIDTSNDTIEQSLQKIISYIKE